MKIYALMFAVIVASGCGKTSIETCADEIERVVKSGGEGAVATCNQLSNEANVAAVKIVADRNPGMKLSLSRGGVPMNELAEKAQMEEVAQEKKPTKKPLATAAAKQKSQSALRLIDTTARDLRSAVETSDSSGFVEYVTRPLSDEIKSWNEHEYPFEFEACRAALIEAHSYSMAVYREHLSPNQAGGVRNRKDREWSERHLKELKTQCRAAVNS